jgi:hypothetical protein
VIVSRVRFVPAATTIEAECEFTAIILLVDRACRLLLVAAWRHSREILEEVTAKERLKWKEGLTG